MGWQDDPIISDEGWRSDPVSSETAASKSELPDSWIGPLPSRSIESYASGRQYLKLSEQNLTGKRGTIEEIFDPELKDMPVIGIAEVPSMLNVANTARKLAKRQPVSDEDLIQMNNYLEFSKRKENATIGSKVVDTIQTSLSFGVELAGALALSGVGVGEGIAAGTTAKVAATRGARLAVARMINRSVGKSAGNVANSIMRSAVRGNFGYERMGQVIKESTEGLIKSVLGEAVGESASRLIGVGAELGTRGLVGAALMPDRVGRAYAERRITDAISLGDESAAASFGKAFLDMSVEVGSEFSGKYIGNVAKRLLPEKVRNTLAKASVFNWISKRTGSTQAKAVWGSMQAMGLNGMLEEMGEERVGGFLRGLFGVDGQAGLVNALKQAWPSGEQFATEAIAFAVMPIMANGLSRVSGGASFTEQAKAIELLKKIARPQEDVHAMSPEQIQAQAIDLHNRIKDESTFWFSGTPLKFMEKIFGTERVGATQSILTNMGVANMRRVHDLAEKKNPGDPNAGADAIGGWISSMQGLHTEGINTTEQAAEFNAGVKSGDIKMLSRGRYFVNKTDVLTKDDVYRIARRTGLASITPIDEREMRSRVGVYDAADFAQEWDAMPADQRKTFEVRWHTKDQRVLKEKYDLLRRAIPFAKARNFEALPEILTATRAQYETETGYTVPEGSAEYGKNDKGETIYAFAANAVTSADGTEIDISTKADIGDIAEDNIEAAWKQIHGVNLTPEIDAWLDGIHSEVVAKKKKTVEEKQTAIELAPGNKMGRFEYAVKSYYMNNLGYKHHRDVGMHHRRYSNQAIPEAVDAQFRAVVGQPLLDALAYQPMAKASSSVPGPVAVEPAAVPNEFEAESDLAGVEAVANNNIGIGREVTGKDLHDAAMLAMQSFSLQKLEVQSFVGGAKVDPNAVGASAFSKSLSPGQIAFLNSLEGDERKKAFRDILRQYEAHDEAFADLKRAIETGDPKHIAQAASHYLIRRPDVTTPKAREKNQDRVINATNVYHVDPKTLKVTRSTLNRAETRHTEPAGSFGGEIKGKKQLDMRGTSERNDRNDQYPTPEEFEAVFSESELRSEAPAWLPENPEVFNDWLNHFDTIDLDEVVDTIYPEVTEDEHKDLVAQLEAVPAKLMKSLPIYAEGARRVTMPSNRTRAGKSLVATHMRPPLTLKEARLLIDQASEQADADEVADISDKLGDKNTGQRVTAKADLTERVLPPRPFWRMAPLAPDIAVVKQLTQVAFYGGQSISRAVKRAFYGYGNLEHSMIDLAEIPTIDETLSDGEGKPIQFQYDPKKNRKVYRTWDAWLTDITQMQLPKLNTEQIAHLNKAARSILNESIDTEAVIAVLDLGNNTLEQELGLPIERIIHAAITGEWAGGRVRAEWWHDKSKPGEDTLERNMLVDDVLSELDTDPTKQIDFQKDGVAQVSRAAVLPITLVDLQTAAESESYRKQLEQKIEDFLVTNRARKILVAGLDQMISGDDYSFKSKDGTKINMPTIKVVPASWEQTLGTILKNAMGKDQRARSVEEGDKAQVAYTPAQILTLDDAMREALKYKQAAGTTWSMREVFSAVRSFNNNRSLSDVETLTFKGWVRKAMNGDRSGKEWLYRNLDASDRQRFADIVQAPAPTTFSLRHDQTLAELGAKLDANGDVTNIRETMEGAARALEFTMPLVHRFMRQALDNNIVLPLNIATRPDVPFMRLGSVNAMASATDRFVDMYGNSLTDSKTAAYALAHEWLHTLTANELDSDPGFKQAISASLEHARRYVKESGLKGLYGNLYGLTNEHEFVSEAFSSSQFQRFLASIPSEFAEDFVVKSDSSLWSDFVDAVTEFVNGLFGDRASLLDDVINDVLSLSENVNTKSMSREDVQEESPVAESALNVEDMQTRSMHLIEDINAALDPIYRSGSAGFHRKMLEIMHNMRAVQFEQTATIAQLREKLGLFRKGVPSDHKARVEDMLVGIGAALDGSNRIPVGWNPDGSVRWDAQTPEQKATSWNQYVQQNNLGMPTFQEVAAELRQKFDSIRDKYNDVVDGFSNDEWIKYLNNYLPHLYRFRNDAERDAFIASVREQSNRAKGRVFETYQKAAEVRRMLPRTMNALDLYEEYGNTVHSAAKNRALTNMASVIKDIDGAPILIPVKMAGSGGVDDLVLRDTLAITARNLADFMGLDVDPSLDPMQEINRLVSQLDLPGNDYERMDSPLTKSIDFFVVRKGTSSNLMKMVLNYGRMEGGLVKAIEHVNAWSKFLLLSASAFHPFALAESLSATFGMSLKNPWLHPLKTHATLKSIIKAMRTEPERFTPWIKRGLIIPTTSPDVQMGTIGGDIQRWMDKLDQSDKYVKTVMMPGLKALKWYKGKVDQWLWSEVHPAMKMMSAEFVMNEWRTAHPTATTEEVEEVGKQISDYLNKAFGGLDWSQYTWATPRTMQWLHLGVFAPDWTTAAAEISGITRLPLINRMHATAASPLMKSEQLRRYWPAYISMTLIAVPNLLQLLIYSIWGDPDKKDVPFNFMNEVGKETYIDFTPLFRKLPLYDGGDSGQRRTYMRWGKQAYEISEGWMQDPAMVLRKSSSMVRQAFEQVTGTTVSGFELPFAGKGLLGIIAVDGSIRDSRIGNMAKMFSPITLGSIAKGEFAAFIAPGAKGLSQGKAIKTMQEVLEAYVDKTSLPQGMENVDLQAAVGDVIGACRKNGINPDLAFKTAKGAVAGKYYKAFFQAMNENDVGAMEDAAEKVLLLGNGIDQIEGSLKRRVEAVDREYTPDMARAVKDAVDKAKLR